MDLWEVVTWWGYQSEKQNNLLDMLGEGGIILVIAILGHAPCILEQLKLHECIEGIGEDFSFLALNQIFGLQSPF